MGSDIHNKHKLILSYIETAKYGKTLKSPPGGNWIHKLWSITTTEFLEAAKEKKKLRKVPYVAIKISLENPVA